MADDAAGGYPGGWLGVGATGLGTASDIYSFINNLLQRQRLNRIAEILSDPRKLSAYINRLYAPMTAVQNTAVQRDLGANWATMTGGAPGGAMNQFVADALAKIENQRYQEAASRGVGALTGAIGAQGAQLPIGATGQVLQLLRTLQAIRQKPQAAPRIATPSLEGGGGYNPDPYAAEANQGVFPAPMTATVPTFD